MTVTSPRGFRATGITAGLKASGKPDLALVVNDGPLEVGVAVFTANRFAAAPVLWSRQVVADGQVRAAILNSGGANACTGPEGFADTHHTAEKVAEALGAAGDEIGPGDVVVCSTGLIGERLPMELLLAGVDAAVAGLAGDGGADAAVAIMTTDTRPKTASAARDGVTVGGMAKGAGMLAPALATMLVVVTTDAVVDAETAERVLRRATAMSFDRIDSDGCMSTNDTVLLMASGASGVTLDEDLLQGLVTDVCADLALQLIGDAEGATKDIAITVVNAASEPDAVAAARSVARSNLLKCAIHGEDPNWGRILSAVGTTDAAFEADQVDVAINGVWVARGGGVGDPREGVDMSGRIVRIVVDLAAGTETATVWTNDLTADYVHENSAYST
jgi:glutamate N-acetyltransferase/amino-acid N-acetyltransferase